LAELPSVTAGPDTAARLYHRLSSFDWFDDDPPTSVGGPAVLLSPEPVRSAEPVWRAALTGILSSRVSVREFSGEPLTQDELAYVAWCGYGRLPLSGLPRRTVPSAGGLFAMRLIAALRHVDGVRAGWYDVSDGAPEPISVAPVDEVGSLFRTRHVPFERAAVVMFVMGDFDEPARQYGERGYRYLLLEAGHIAQNLLLACAATELAAVPLGGFDDDQVNSVLAAGSALYTVAIGRPQWKE
jgi:SagB-type dehydrogenase family enzyme